MLKTNSCRLHFCQLINYSSLLDKIWQIQCATVDHRDSSGFGALFKKKKKNSKIPGGDAAEDSIEVVATQREEDG